MIRVRDQKVVVLFLMLGVGTGLWSLSRPAAAQDVKAFELRDGVIVDLDRQLAYVMNPKGGIDAVELEGGTPVWSTDQAAKPLAVNGDLLVCQAGSSSLQNELKIIVLNIQEREQPVFSDSLKLPDGVIVSIDNTLNSSFTTRAKALGRDVFVSWQYFFHPIKGVDLSDSTLDKSDTEFPRTINGTIRVDLTSRTISSLDSTQVPPGLDPRPPDLSTAERLPGVLGPQFIAADGGHVLSSVRIANDSVWNKYRWTIYDRTTGERVAEIRNYLSYAPFSVLGSKVIFETGPYVRRTENGLVDEPLKIRAVDLQAGKELWSWMVRDTAYRGSFPP